MKMYRRDDKGRIVKKDDHGPDALRYGIMTGPDVMKIKPAKFSLEKWMSPSGSGGWVG